MGGAPGGGAGSHGRGRAPHGRELCQVLGLPAAAGMSSLSRGFVACCSRFANLSYVAIPLRDKRVTQRKLSDYFAITRVYKGCKNVKVQQQLTKYFTLKPKADRAGAVAPRCRHRRHRRHRHHHHLLHIFNAAVARLTMGCSPLPAQRGRPAQPRGDRADRRRRPAEYHQRALQVSGQCVRRSLTLATRSGASRADIGIIETLQSTLSRGAAAPS